MPGTEDVEKPVYRKEPVYATKYYYEIDKWTVVDTAKSSGNDQNPSWPEPKLKDGQRTGAEEEHYFVTATYEKKKGKTETGRYEMDFSQWKELKKGEKIELKIRHYIAENCNIGSRLPSILTFAEQYEVSAKTVKKALDNLSEEGYITFTRGRYGGTFVTDIPQGVNEAYKWLALSPEYATNIEKLEN